MIALLALTLGLVLPGLAGGVALTALSDDPARAGVLLARSLSCGLAIWLISMGVCEQTVGLSAGAVWTVGALLAAASVVTLLLPFSRRVLQASWRDLAYGLGLAALGIAVWLPMALLNLATSWAPLQPTPWYYWGLAEQIANAGHVPSTSIEWGIRVPFLDDYHLFSTATAALIQQTPGNGLLAVRAMMVIAVITGACGASLLAVSLRAGRLCSVLAVPVFLAIAVFAEKLSSYRPEAFAYGLAFLAAVAAIDWLQRRDRGALMSGALMLAVLAQIHGVILIVAAAAVVACMVAFLPRFTRADLVRHLGASGVLFLTWTATTFALALALGTRVGTENTGELADMKGLADPTWEFVRAITALPSSSPPSSWQLARSAIRTSFYGLNPWFFGGVAIGTAIILIWVALRGAQARRTDARRVIVFVGAFLVGMALLAAVFAFGWSSYVPRRTGAQRLVQLVVLIVPTLAAVAWSAVSWLSATFRRRLIAGVVVLSSAATLGYLSNANVARLAQTERPDSNVVAALSAVHLPAGSVVLANGYSEGFIAQVLGAPGLLEGRAPYTYGDLLQRADGLLRGAAAFYADPAAHLDFLRANGITHVLVVHWGTWALGTSNIFPALRQRLDKVSELQQMLALDDIALYRVQS